VERATRNPGVDPGFLSSFSFCRYNRTRRHNRARIVSRRAQYAPTMCSHEVTLPHYTDGIIALLRAMPVNSAFLAVLFRSSGSSEKKKYPYAREDEQQAARTPGFFFV